MLGGVGNVLARRTTGRPGMAQAMQAKDPSTVTDPVAKGFRTFAEAGGNDLRALAAYQGSRQERTDAKKLGQVQVPVLLVIGEKDALVGSPEELRKAIPGARLLTIPDRDHLTVVPDQRFKDAVVEFLTETAGE